MELPDDPRVWTPDELAEFAYHATWDELQAATLGLAATHDPSALRVLRSFVYASGGPSWAGGRASTLAARALLSAGPPGVDVLVDAITRGPRLRNVLELLMLLWRASRGDYSMTGQFARLEPPPGTDQAAPRALSDYVADALVIPDRYTDIGQWLQQLPELSSDDDAAADAASDVAALLGQASIRLSRTLLDDYAALIADAHPEETYQQFLTAHPALIDPLAATVLPKLRLGTEYATDFAVRRHDDRWLLVEIEKPCDPIFTRQSNFRVAFTHAYGQVLDFQRWVDDDVAYARNTMPKVVVPRGLLIIGRRTDMSDHQQKKLAQLVSNSARIDVVTFDDLLC
jgi:hypothetical protein